ncbi:MAG: class I tRNA ligase family protein, partial [Cyanobacteria bacterium P01_D01_bin.128]
MSPSTAAAQRNSTASSALLQNSTETDNETPNFQQKYPADFISEGVDQTRGWFYTLHAIA